MFLISDRQKTADVFNDIYDWYCYGCCKNTKWKLSKITKWLSVLNWRALPLKKAYQLTCSGCSCQLGMSHHESRKIEQKSINHHHFKETKVYQQLSQRIVLQQLAIKGRHNKRHKMPKGL